MGRLLSQENARLKYSLIALVVLLCLSGLISYTNSVDENKMVEMKQPTIENIRARYEARIMAIPGVVFVGNGISKNGSPCLKIGTSVPVEKIRSQLPEELSKIEVELEYIGEIRAQ